MNLRGSLPILLSTVSIGLAACRDGDEDSSSPKEVTWVHDIAPLFGEKCVGCHYTGSTLSSFTFDNYIASAATAEYALAKIVGDDNVPYVMPPFPPPDDKADCVIPRPLKDDPRLTQEEKDLVRAWVDAGTPEGDPEDAVDFVPQPPPILTGPNVVSLPAASHTVPAKHDGDIDYTHCFSVDLGLTDTGYLTGVAFGEDTKGIVHHVIISTDPYGDTRPEGEDNGGVYDCGTDEIRMSEMLMTWTAGQAPLRMPPDSGFPMPAGARLLFTIHYHMGASEVLDHPYVDVEWAEGTPTWLAYMDRYGGASTKQTDWEYMPEGRGGWIDPPFSLPANETNWKQIWREDHIYDFEEKQRRADELGLDITIEPEDWRLWGVFPHMHYAGSNIRISLDHKDGTETCLANIGPWDFEWQQNYLYDYTTADELPMFYRDDTVTIDCDYNNSMSNQRLAEALLAEGYEGPFDMTVGENGLNEMCVMHYGLLRPMTESGI